MKWLFISDGSSTFQTLFQGDAAGQGTPAPARFVEWILAQGDEIVLVIPASAVPRVATAYDRHGLRIVPFRDRGPSWRRLLAFPALYAQLSRLVAVERPDVIYCAGYEGMIGAYCARRHVIPAVSRFYGTFVNQLRDPRFWVSRSTPKLLGELMALKMAKDGVVMTDDGTFGDRACRWVGIEADRLLFLRNGVDVRGLQEIADHTDVAAVRASLNLGMDDLVVTNVSRLSSWKRVDLVIDAFGALPRSLPQAKLLIVGAGSQEPALRRLRDASPRRGDIHFVGEQSRHRTLQIMRSSNVLTSFYEVSNVGNVLLEGLALGAVTVTRDTGATRAVVTDGVNGFMLPADAAGAVAGFARIIDHLVRNPHKASTVSRNARAWAAANLSTWDRRMHEEYLWIRRRAALPAA